MRNALSRIRNFGFLPTKIAEYLLTAAGALVSGGVVLNNRQLVLESDSNGDATAVPPDAGRWRKHHVLKNN